MTMNFGIVLFNIHTPLCEFLGILICKARFRLVCFFRNDSLGTFVGDTVRVDNGRLFASNTAANDWVLGPSNSRLEYLDLVWVYLPTHNALSQSVTSGNDDYVTESCENREKWMS